MHLTKFTHSCVRLDTEAGRLVIDPGIYSELPTALEDAHAVLVTHEHPDHVDTEALIAAAGRTPEMRIWCPAPVAEQLAPLGDRVRSVGAGESFQAAGLPVRTFGGQHALIHSSVPVVPNLGYLVADVVYHPGDSFTVPEQPVATLLLPIHGPWSKIGEVLDFLISVRPAKVHQLHDGLLNERGLTTVEGHVERVAQRYGSRFEHLDAGCGAAV